MRALWLLPLAALVVSCDAAPSAPVTRGARGSPRGVFLIVADTLRSDRLSCYGDRGQKTPHADRLAASGVRFARARAPASWTVPSMGAMLTSRLPAELSLLEDPDDPDWPKRRRQARKQIRMSLAGAPPTLADLMRQRGFRTGAFVDQPLLSLRRGFLRGFDDWFQPSGKGEVSRNVLEPARGADTAPTWGKAVFAFENDRALVKSFEAWLHEHAAQTPVFAWIHLLTPHRPYTRRRAFPVPFRASPSERYDAEVRATDALLGRALAAIDAHVGLQNAVVLFTSDHGEAFGEHGSVEHGNSLHREVLAVPLLLSAPGRVPAGVTVQALVRTIDIAPTLLELAGAQVPSEMRGESLLSLIDAPPRSRPIYAEGMLYGPTERAYTEGGYKLHLDDAASGPALYDVNADPDERVDLADREPERVAALRERMQTLRDQLKPVEAASRKRDEGASARAALRALGYAE